MQGTHSNIHVDQVYKESIFLLFQISLYVSSEKTVYWKVCDDVRSNTIELHTKPAQQEIKKAMHNYSKDEKL